MILKIRSLIELNQVKLSLLFSCCDKYILGKLYAFPELSLNGELKNSASNGVSFVHVVAIPDSLHASRIQWICDCERTGLASLTYKIAKGMDNEDTSTVVEQLRKIRAANCREGKSLWKECLHVQ